jgi:hypothetical protein
MTYQAATSLCVGVVIDGQPARWIVRALEAVAALPRCRLTRVHFAPSLSVDSSRNWRNGASYALLRGFQRLDRRWFGRSATLLALDTLPSSLAALQSDGCVPDVWLSFNGSRPPDDCPPPSAGVWTLRIGGQTGGDPELWTLHDLLLRKPSVRVQWCGERSDRVSVVLAECDAVIDARSLVRSQQRVLPSVQTLLVTALRRLVELGPGALYASQQVVPSPRFDAPPAPPKNRAMAAYMLDHALRVARERLDLWLYDSRWALALRLGDRFPSARPFTLAEPPSDRYWADPFACVHEGQRYVFYEEVMHGTPSGRIAVAAVDSDGAMREARPVLERPHHLSYPFLFRYNGERFMIPETSQGGQIEAYRARSFPDDWRLEAVLLRNVRATDVTLHYADDRWWMFADMAKDETNYHSEELHLFYSTSPFGPWTPHRANPVVCGASHARPAGALFMHEGALYRPAQDCKVHYGRAIVLQRVEELTPEVYREATAQCIEPDWDPRIVGTHTLNHEGDLTVMDVRLRVPLAR